MAASPPDDARIAQHLLICRIIAAALAFGVIAFAVVAVVLRWNKPPEGFLISAIAVGASVVAVVARAAVLGVMASRAAGDDGAAGIADDAAAVAREHGVPDSRLPEVRDAVAERFDAVTTDLGEYQARLVVGLAMLEGAAFFDLIAYLLEGRWWTILAAGVLLLWMLTAYPTAGKLARWLDDRRLLREFGPNRT